MSQTSKTHTPIDWSTPLGLVADLNGNQWPGWTRVRTYRTQFGNIMLQGHTRRYVESWQ